jgi:hypothetical protein
MTATKYGPDDTWPVHQKPFWNQTLSEARQAGWTLTYINAPHRFGSVACPAGQHTFDVDKTANGGETKSKQAIRKIRWCEHGPGVEKRRQECVCLLDVADQLISTVKMGLTRAEAKQAAHEDLDRLELQLQTACANIDEVLLAKQDDALRAAVEVDDALDPEALVADLDDAAAGVEHGAAVAKTLTPPAPKLAKLLLERASAARTSIEELRGRLAALRERILDSSR